MAEEEKRTLTLKRATVEELKTKKRAETWDDLLLRLARRQRCGIECMVCGKWIETTDAHVSPSVLAEMNKWREVSCEGEVKLGYVCPNCAFPGGI